MRGMAIAPTPLHPTKTKQQQLMERRLNETIEQALHRMYVAEGLDQAAIGEALGIKQATVSRWMRDFGIPTRG
jgi:DNA-binding transcriptional regulator LsrR (DeoR family)